MADSTPQYRAQIFKHLDGIVTAPVAYCLYKKGVVDYLLKHKQVSLATITGHFKANEGYLNVALRVLCSQGWLRQSIEGDTVYFYTNDNSNIAARYFPCYENVVALLKLGEQFHPRKFELTPFLALEKLMADYKRGFGLPEAKDATAKIIRDQIFDHIEGCMLAPTIVRLAMSGMFHQYFMEASFSPEEFHEEHESFRKILDFFSELRWFSKKNGHYSFTEKGMFFAKRASAYGVTVSYIPTFRHVEELLFGNPNYLWDKSPHEDERHVDREMNVWGSGGAHQSYFKVIDKIIIELFNQPIDKQPKGILDMGCGNGAFLQHLFELIDRHTLRGQMLDEYPLFLVGADYNQAALKVTRANLIKADIWAKVIWGDISNPDQLAKDLTENYSIALGELLNVRTFLDHNRIWEQPDIIHKDRRSNSSGAFAYKGQRLDNALVEDNLLMHLRRWTPYVSRFGLLVIELHTIDPALTAANLGNTAATAYDATHGFSDQYILELDVFHRIAKEAGLSPVTEHFRRFPDTDYATVSINLLRAGK